MIYYHMTCGLAVPVIVGVLNGMVYHIGKSIPTKRSQCKGCTFERIPEHAPVHLDYPVLLQFKAV